MNLRVMLTGCYTSTLDQYACEGQEMYISCTGQLVIQVVNANYGRLDNSMCADPILGIPNENCRHDVACIVRKWFA